MLCSEGQPKRDLNKVDKQILTGPVYRLHCLLWFLWLRHVSTIVCMTPYSGIVYLCRHGFWWNEHMGGLTVYPLRLNHKWLSKAVFRTTANISYGEWESNFLLLFLNRPSKSAPAFSAKERNLSLVFVKLIQTLTNI